MVDPNEHVIARLSDLREGLRRNDPEFCGDAPLWVVETVLRNLESATTQSRQMEWVRSFALGGMRFVTDQDATRCDTLLERLAELLETTG
jgi:hypothetical protein